MSENYKIPPTYLELSLVAKTSRLAFLLKSFSSYTDALLYEIILTIRLLKFSLD